MSLLAHWVDELYTRAGCREGSVGGPFGLQLIVYYGVQRAELPPTMSSRHVVLTSYGTVASEWNLLALSNEQHPTGSSGRKRNANGSVAASGLHRVRWRRVVIDEAHEIKNASSLTARAVFALQAERRWAVTGSSPIACRCGCVGVEGSAT